jgi:MFS family permease
MEHDNLVRAFVLSGLAAGAAVVLAGFLFTLWIRRRRTGRPVATVGIALVVSVAIAGLSGGWLAYERHEKCDRTVARKLCDSPVDWLRSL